MMNFAVVSVFTYTEKSVQISWHLRNSGLKPLGFPEFTVALLMFNEKVNRQFGSMPKEIGVTKWEFTPKCRKDLAMFRLIWGSERVWFDERD